VKIPIQIHAVEVHEHPGIRGFVDSPRPGTRVAEHLLPIVGWLLGDRVPVVAVELTVGAASFRRLPLGDRRPDVEEAFAGPGAATAGFHTAVGLLDTQASELQLSLRAVLGDGTRAEFATIRGGSERREGCGARETVSVVIPCFQQAHYLPEAIESVLAQGVSCLEVVVVDDGSHDNTRAVVGRYPGVRYVRQHNRGLAAARNTGVQHATGDYLVFLDADDRLFPHALELGVATLEAHPEAAFAAGQVTNIGSDGEVIATPEQILPEDPYVALLEGCFIWAPAAAIFRRAAVEELGGFDESVSASADFALYLGAARSGRAVLHDGRVAEYRRHSASMTRDPSLILRSELRVLRAQARFAAERAGGRESLRAGLRRAREYHGSALAEHASQLLASRSWRAGARTLATAARAYPPGVLRALRDGLPVARADGECGAVERTERKGAGWVR
jgi:hypothetical protein